MFRTPGRFKVRFSDGVFQALRGVMTNGKPPTTNYQVPRAYRNFRATLSCAFRCWRMGALATGGFAIWSRQPGTKRARSSRRKQARGQTKKYTRIDGPETTIRSLARPVTADFQNGDRAIKEIVEAWSAITAASDKATRAWAVSTPKKRAQTRRRQGIGVAPTSAR